MKTLISRTAITLVIASLMGISAIAKSKTESIKLDTNIKVNGTLVKKGTYDMKFEEEKGELSLIKNGKVVATASTTTEKRDRKAKLLEYRTNGSGDDTQLVKVAFPGSDFNVIVSNSAASN